MVVVVAVVGVVIGGKIVVMEVVDEDYLMKVEVVEEDWLMNAHVFFGMYHRQDCDLLSWEISFRLLGPYGPRMIWCWWYILQQCLLLVERLGCSTSSSVIVGTLSKLWYQLTRSGKWTTLAESRTSTEEPWKSLQVRIITRIHEQAIWIHKPKRTT